MVIGLLTFIWGQPHLQGLAEPADAARLRQRSPLGLNKEWTIYLCSLLGVAVGQALVSRAAPGTEAKLTRLFELAATEPVRNWEASLLVEGTPQTLLFSAVSQPSGHTLLVGNLVPEQYSDMVRQVSDTVAELGQLQRQSERQQRELRDRHDELMRLNLELDDSARGMAALHAEVEEFHPLVHRQPCQVAIASR